MLVCHIVCTTHTDLQKVLVQQQALSKAHSSFACCDAIQACCLGRQQCPDNVLACCVVPWRGVLYETQQTGCAYSEQATQNESRAEQSSLLWPWCTFEHMASFIGWIIANRQLVDTLR